MEQQLLDLKIVGAGEFDDLHTRQIQLVHHGRKFPLLVLPEDDAALIEFRQRGGKTLLQSILNRFYRHNPSPIYGNCSCGEYPSGFSSDYMRF